MHSASSFLVPLAALAFSTAGPATKVALEALDPYLLTFSRCALAGLCLGAFLLVRHRPGRALFTRRARLLSVASGLFFGCHILSFVAGVNATSYVSAMSLLAMEPISIVGVGLLFFGIRPRPGQVLGILFAVAGALVIVTGSAPSVRETAAGGYRAGDLLILLSIFFYCFYFACNRALSRELRPGSSVAFAAVIYLVAGGLAGMLWLSGSMPGTRPFGGDSRTWVAVVILGLVPTLVGHSLYQVASRLVSPAWVGMVSPGETLGSIALGMILLGTYPTVTELWGGTLILAGAVMVALSERTVGV